MDPVIGTLLGVALGSAVSMLTVRLQTRQLEIQRRQDRRYDQLLVASRSLRASVVAAMDLDYTRSLRARALDPAVWGPRWQSFVDRVALAFAALSVVRADLDAEKLTRLEKAMAALGEERKSNREVLGEYLDAVTVLRRDVEDLARALADPKAK